MLGTISGRDRMGGRCRTIGAPSRLALCGSQDGLLVVRRFLDGARGGLYMQPNTIDEAFTPYGETEIVFR